MTESYDVSVDEWVDYLSDGQLPVLAESAQKLTDLTASELSRASALTEQVLKDPHLTSRLLQVANSVGYRNPSGKVTTISRAILWLGFASVRDITLSMKILDAMLAQSPSLHLLDTLAQSFHAAMQARSMVEDRRGVEREEVFISALLRRLGEMALLSRDDEVSRRLNHLIDDKHIEPAQAASDVLGCSFEDITVGLSRRWGLSPLIADSLLHPSSGRDAIQGIVLADELSRKVALGWDHPEVVETVGKIAAFRKVNARDCFKQLGEVARMARDLSVHYGAGRVRELIPLAKAEAKPQAAVVATVGDRKPESAGAALARVDTSAQMRLMQDIAAFMQVRGFDINQLFSVCLGGIREALAMRRVGLALLSKDRKNLVFRSVPGSDPALGAALSGGLEEDSVFSRAIRSAQPVWLGGSAMAGMAYLLTPSLKNSLGTRHCVVAPLVVSGKPIGLIHADNGQGDNPISDQQYSGFCMAVQQVSMVLTAVSTMRPAS